MNTRLPLDWLNEHREEMAQRVAMNVERDRKRARDGSRRRRESDPEFRILCGLRNQVRHALIRGKWEIASLVGCSLSELRAHFESQFRGGMTWANSSEWEIDHVIPCARFDMTIRAERVACFHYTNLRPLWSAQNRLKRAY